MAGYAPIQRYPAEAKKPPTPEQQYWFTLLVTAVNTLLQGTQTGMGTPEGVIFAPQGSLYRRTDGGAGTTLYTKTTADTLSTGWSALS